jgi:hypothetical protein
MNYSLQVAPVRKSRPMFDTGVQRLIYGPARLSPLLLSVTGHASQPQIRYNFRSGIKLLLRRILL